MINVTYKNRVEAGRKLFDALQRYKGRQDVLVLGLPRGGVPVASEVAGELGADLDLVLVRKLGVPGHEEVAMGAIASGGVEVINEDVMKQIRAPDAVIEKIRQSEKNELERRELAYRGGRPPYDARNKIVILVDDGIATGATMKAAVMALRQSKQKHLVIAVPVGPADTIHSLREIADEVICPATPVYFRSVGEWYHDFSQTTDTEVKGILARAWHAEKRRVA
jgi:putative phosphoribosyl transferase